MICNRSKLNRTVDQFKEHIFSLNRERVSFEEYREQSKLIPLIIRDVKQKKLYNTVNRVFLRYDDEDLNIDQLFQLCGMECYYCGRKPSNRKNYDNSHFIYNGLDRIDNNFGHSYNNVIPCCKWCNYAKQSLTIDEFYDWAKRAYNHLFSDQLNSASISSFV